MRKNSSAPGMRGLISLVVVGAALLGLAAGCERYGGVEGVVDRVRAKAAEYRPHPDQVPTPFTEAGGPPIDLPALGTNAVSPLAAAAGQSPLETATEPVTPTQPVAEPDATSTALPQVMITNAPTAAPPPATASPTETAPPAKTLGQALAYRPAQPSVALNNIAHYWQTWNNCGPATLAMNLSYYGSKLDQAAVAAVLRPDKDDKNLGPDEMVAFAQAQGFKAITRVNGNAQRLKLLLSNGVPVIVETWMEPKPNDGMGHYRLLSGYDDKTQEWIAYDSYEARGVDPKKPYAGIRLPYAEVSQLWRVFDNTYVVVYTAKEAAAVAAIVGPDMDATAMWQRALASTEKQIQSNQADAYGWFNLGTELTGLGRYAEAGQAYDRARRLGLPWRMLWYQFGPFQAYYETQRYDEIVALADATLKTTNTIEELYYWKGMALQAKGDVAGARQAWQRALQLNKNYAAPAQALAKLG